MIDTIRFRGPADMVKFNWDYSRFTGFKRKNGNEYIHEIIVRKTPEFQAIYYPSNQTMDVQCNIHKTLFEHNVYNYTDNPAILGGLVRSFASCFFRSSSMVYVTRCDIGGVITYENETQTKETLESFRRCRLPGARTAKYRHQNYPDSVFYNTTNWSFKIYNKGVEMGDNANFFPHFSLLNTLRFEKTFRFKEMKRLGMQIKSGMGVEISEFDVSLLVDDFYDLLAKWEFSQTPHVTDKTGGMGLLSVIDQSGILSDVEAMGIVSRSTMWRYKKLKKDKVEKKKIQFVQNLPPELLRELYKHNTFGVQSVSKLLKF